MSVSKTKFIRRWDEHKSKDCIKDVPENTRGVYALLERKRKSRARPKGSFEVVYIGIATGQIGASISSRLRQHDTGSEAKPDWTHFSAFEVFPDITKDEIKELEALFLLIYAEDLHAIKFNKKRRGEILKGVKMPLSEWRKSDMNLIFKPHSKSASRRKHSNRQRSRKKP